MFLVQSFYLVNLERLDLRYNRIDDNGIKEVLKNTKLKNTWLII
jgi:hypothetical protein